jgi:DNA polymerase elongation subunit (family B)
MNCNYLFQEDVLKITKEEMITAINKRFKDDDPEEAPVKEMIIEKLEEVLSAGPNEAQFNKFLTKHINNREINRRGLFSIFVYAALFYIVHLY